MPCVDIFVPCYNYGRYLRQCVESITTQVDVDVRVLIIDDCSTDDSHQVGMELAAADDRISYRRHLKNAGHIATYNEALEWTKNEYTVLLSADDMLTPGSLSRAVRLMEGNPQIGFVYGRNVRLVGGKPQREARTPYPHFDATIWNGRRWLEYAFRDRRKFIDAPEVVVRTRMYKTYGGYRPELPHTADVELWLRLASHGDVGEIEADQAYYRVHDSNMHSVLAPSTVRSLEHWNSAFETFFRNDGRQLPERGQLHEWGFSSLANMALNAAYAPTDARDHGIRSELIEFATRVCPSVRSLSGRFQCGYTNGRVRDPWGIKRLFGVPAYLFRRLLTDTSRSLRFLVSGDSMGAAFELGRSCAHASLIAEGWLAKLIPGRSVGLEIERQPTRVTNTLSQQASKSVAGTLPC